MLQLLPLCVLPGPCSGGGPARVCATHDAVPRCSAFTPNRVAFRVTRCPPRGPHVPLGGPRLRPPRRSPTRRSSPSTRVLVPRTALRRGLFPRRPGAVRRLPRAGKTFAFLVTCWGPWPKSPATAWVGLALVCALFTLAWVGASLSLKPGTSETWQGGGGGTTQPAGGWQRARILCPYLKVGTRFVWVPALWSLRGVVPLCPVEACPLWWPGQRAQKRVLLLAATSANPLPPLPTHASARSAAQPRWARTHRRTVGAT